MGAEILAVYPARLTTGKQFEKVAALTGAIKAKTEKDSKVVFCDFPSADIPSGVYKTMIRMEGKKYGLHETDMLFTSDIGYRDGFPRKGVFELFALSNLFICPSYSESFGLTVLEAGSRGNFLVLNEAVPALKELGETLGPILCGGTPEILAMTPMRNTCRRKRRSMRSMGAGSQTSCVRTEACGPKR